MPGSIILNENGGHPGLIINGRAKKKEELNMPIKGIAKNRISQRQGSISIRRTCQVYSGLELVERLL